MANMAKVTDKNGNDIVLGAKHIIDRGDIRGSEGIATKIDNSHVVSIKLTKLTCNVANHKTTGWMLRLGDVYFCMARDLIRAGSNIFNKGDVCRWDRGWMNHPWYGAVVQVMEDVPSPISIGSHVECIIKGRARNMPVKYTEGKRVWITPNYLTFLRWEKAEEKVGEKEKEGAAEKRKEEKTDTVRQLKRGDICKYAKEGWLWNGMEVQLLEDVLESDPPGYATVRCTVRRTVPMMTHDVGQRVTIGITRHLVKIGWEPVEEKKTNETNEDNSDLSNSHDDGDVEMEDRIVVLEESAAQLIADVTALEGMRKQLAASLTSLQTTVGGARTQRALLEQKVSTLSIKLKELEKKSGNEPLLPHPPLLWDRVTGKGPFVQLVSATGVGAEDAKADKFGRQPFYNGLNDGQKSNQGWFKAWPETMTTERPEEKEKCQDAKADEVIETKNQPISGWAIIVTIVISAIAANLYHWLQPIF